MIRVDHAIVSVHAKASCYLCGATNDLVDTGVSIDYEGVLAICRACVRDMALTGGFAVGVDQQQLDDLKEELEQANYMADSILAATTAVQATLTDVRKKHRDRLRQFRLRQSQVKA